MKKQIDEIITDKNTLQEMLPFAQFYANLATKDDLLRVETSLKDDLLRVETSLEAKISKVEVEISKLPTHDQLDLKLEKMQNKMLYIMAGMFAATISILTFIMKWMHV